MAPEKTEHSLQHPTTGKKFNAKIDADLKELIPDLFKEIKGAIETMYSALANNDVELLGRLGHGFKGACANYGLDELSKIFFEIEKGAKNNEKETVKKALASATDYIAYVEIEYVSE